MKPLNTLTVFTRPSIFAAAMSVAVVFAFVSSASAGEKNFDVLSGVTAEALTPTAMDAIQGTGSIHVSYLAIDAKHYHPIVKRSNPGKVDVRIRLDLHDSGRVTITKLF